MPARFRIIAVFSSMLVASLALAGSLRSRRTADPLTSKFNRQGTEFLNASRFEEAAEQFRLAAVRAEARSDAYAAAMNWNNAGASLMIEMRFHPALEAYGKAKRLAAQAGELVPLVYSLNNLANLYIHMGQPEAAYRVASEALAGVAHHAAPLVQAKLQAQMGIALMGMGRYAEALPVYREAIGSMQRNGDYVSAVRTLSSLGDEGLKANRTADAEAALNEAMQTTALRHLHPSASVLDGMGKLRAKQNRPALAAAFFEQALTEPPGVTPRWKLYSDRAHFRYEQKDLRGALADLREARRLTARMRLDVVPADQDRVALESGLSDVAQQLVAAGNRLAIETGDRALLEETFDAAEQDRQWSLRALIPEMGDWRSKLPDAYWGLLAKYQSLQRAGISESLASTKAEEFRIGEELRHFEAQAGRKSEKEAMGALASVRQALRDDTVLFSFHVSRTSAWLWAADRAGTDVFRLPSVSVLQRQAGLLVAAVKEGKPEAEQAGRELYGSLFGQLPARYLSRSRWLLEPDGPLYGVPFAALVTSGPDAPPVYLVERATLQSVPGALLLEQGPAAASDELLAIGDPIYNRADNRFQGTGSKMDLSLPRLPNTSAELEACGRAWGTQRTRLLTGSQAAIGNVDAAMRSTGGILHFATHVVPSPQEFRTGLIALSLDRQGGMGLLGPREIVSRPVRAALVVMDGCFSAQADALPGSGLMGLTRAWIGAGAHAVLATQWDIADEDSASLMVAFYESLARRGKARAAEALRDAQISQLRRGSRSWAGYFLESRIL